MSLLSRAGAIALAFSLLFATPVGAATLKQRARLAVHWLSHRQNPDGSFPGFSPIGSTADAIVSFVAAQRSPEDIEEALGYLEASESDVDTIGEIAKVVMAVVASGGDPRSFAGRDLVQEIVSSEQPDGRYGATTEVFNHALAILALRMTDEEPSQAAIDWLLDAQCADGGWQYDAPSGPTDDAHCDNGTDADFFFSETDATAYAVIALATFKAWNKSSPMNPFRFFKSRRDQIKDGWGYDARFPLTNTNSTALVIEAYRAHSRDLPDGARRALTRLQHKLCGSSEKAGAFASGYSQTDNGYSKGDPDDGGTIAAILGLVDRPYEAVAVTKPPAEPEPC